MHIFATGKLAIILSLLASVCACTARTSGYAGDGDLFIETSITTGTGHIETIHTDYENNAPYLRQFDMVDSYQTNSEFESTHLELSAYKNLGIFEVFWDIRSNDDYIIELRVNDAPYVEGSRLVSSEYCNELLPCYDEQYQYCDFSSNLTLNCDTPNGSAQGTNIDSLLGPYPQDIYLILQTCDTYFHSCEYQSLPVFIDS